MRIEQKPWWQRPVGVVAIVIGAVFVYRLIGLLDDGLRWLFDWGESGVRFSTAGDRVRRGPASRPGGTDWDWAYLWSLFPPVFRGLLVTLRSTLTGFVIALVLGLALALGRRSNRRFISWPTAAFIEFVRSTPLLIQLYVIFRAFPSSLDITLSAQTSLIIGLGIHYATYCSEAYRAGINSVPIGQWEASTAVNFGRVTTWTSVILPQAIPNALPALGNYLVAAFKDAPLGFAIGVTGLLTAAQSINREGYTPGTEEYAVVGVAFLAVSIPAAWLIRRLERKIAYERID